MTKKIKGVLRGFSPKQSFGKREVLGEGKTFDLTKGCPSPKNKEEDVEIKAFLEYICKQEPVDIFTDKISTIIDNIKQQETNKREYESMNIHDQDTFRRGKQEGLQEGLEQGVRQGIQQGIQQGKQEGAFDKAIQTAKNLLAMNLTITQIVQATNLPLETVEQLEKEIRLGNYVL